MPKTVEAPPDTLTLEYNLFDLPTAQHKAGLVGLLILIDVLKQRGVSPLPEITKLTETSASFAVSQESLQSIFDELFDAEWVERESKSKWAGTEPIDEKENVVIKDGKEKKEKIYIYKVFQPKLKFLQDLYPVESQEWINLWREMLWNTLRGIPATRNVFQERIDDSPSSEAKRIWQELLKSEKEKLKSKKYTVSIASSLYIGAQDVNAEKVSFVGEMNENILLYFWTIPSLVFTPRRFDIKGKWENAGYVIIIPEPNLIKQFCKTILEIINRISTKKLGHRPAAAIIDTPTEAGLEYIVQYADENTSQKDYQDHLSKVEIYHLEKQGNSIKMHFSGDIKPKRDVIEEYNAVRHSFYNPYYKHQRFLNLIENKSWYEGFDSLFSHNPREHFIYQSDTRKYPFPFFGNDVRNKFFGIQQEIQNYIEGGISMDNIPDNEKELLARNVYRIISQYVNKKTEKKTNMEKKNLKNNEDIQNFNEQKEKVCIDAFLAIRSRHERNDFVEYFSGSICHPPQWLPQDDYLLVCEALMNEKEWESVRTFSMLALSANSAYGRTFENKKEGEK